MPTSGFYHLVTQGVAQGRTCFLLLIDGAAEQATPALEQFFTNVEQQLVSQQ